MNKYLVTGGTGFLGERLIERLYQKEHDCKIVTVARNEGKIVELQKNFPCIFTFIGDVGDRDIITKLMLHTKYTGIFHLAAQKHIGIAEKQVAECVKSNILGSINIVNSIYNTCVLDNEPDFCIGISTDKATQVNGVYGASKFIMERLFKNADDLIKTKFRLVRYGNVLYSTGSVLCKWKDLILKGKQVIVTDEEATRFFWTRDQAIDLIFECLEKAKDSTPYIPEMKAIRIGDLLRAMYEKYGCWTSRDIKTIGLQPGENLHETVDGINFSNQVDRYTFDEIIKMI